MSTAASLFVGVLAGWVVRSHAAAGTRSAEAWAAGASPHATVWKTVPTGQFAGTVAVTLIATPESPGLSGPLYVQVTTTAVGFADDVQTSSACLGGSVTAVPTGKYRM